MMHVAVGEAPSILFGNKAAAARRGNRRAS
jgi:hypothetical protein